MLFFKGNNASVKSMMKTLDHLYQTTGLEANIEESKISMFRVNFVRKVKLLNITGFVEGPFHLSI